MTLKQAQAALNVSEVSLARAKKGPSEEEIAAAEAAIAAARASLADLVRGPDQLDKDLAELQLDQARNTLYGAQGSRDALGGNPMAGGGQRDTAEAQVLNAEVGVRMAEINLAKLDEAPKASPSPVLALRSRRRNRVWRGSSPCPPQRMWPWQSLR